jgi:nitronate monooxygenase
MQDWLNHRLLDLLDIEIPIIQAPMAGSDSVALAYNVSSTGALGSLACALLSPDGVREGVRTLRGAIVRSINLIRRSLRPKNHGRRVKELARLPCHRRGP